MSDPTAAVLPPRPWPPEPTPRSALNRLLDRVGDEQAEGLTGIELPAFLSFGGVGIVAGFAWGAGLALVRGIPVGLAAAFTITAVATLLVVGFIRRTLTGHESHVLLECVIAVLLVVALLAWWAGQPVWTALDALMPSIGVFLLFGKLGCLVAGCCHGRPAAIGIRYRQPSHDALAGVRLFPLQIVEGGWIAAVTAGATAFVLAGARPGSAVWFWLVGYAAGRLVLDGARGDVRHRIGPLTEAQWLCVGVLAARVGWEGVADGGIGWRALAVVGAAALLVAVAYGTRARWLTTPAPALPVDAITAWQRFLDTLEYDATVRPGTAELRRSAPTGGATVGLLVDRAGGGRHMQSYALRGEREPLDERTALTLAGMIVQRLPAHVVVRAGRCAAGTFHLWTLVEPVGRPGSTADDHPWTVRLRAQGFARALRTIPPLAADAAPPADPPVPAFPPTELPLATTTAPPAPTSAWYFR